MRCVECHKTGHFKCATFQQSEKVKLSFNVADNLDEFLIAHERRMQSYGDDEDKPTAHLSKRERKRLAKE